LCRVTPQPVIFLTTRSAIARRWCDRRSCPEGVMMWVPFGQLKNKLHRYDPDKCRYEPDKGRGVGIGILYLSVKSVVKKFRVRWSEPSACSLFYHTERDSA